MNKKLGTKTIVLGGIFVAISIVLTRMFGFILFDGSVRISFGNVPIALAGVILGPLAGALVGAIADILGIMLVSHGTPHIGFTISSALQGLIPALILYKPYRDKELSKSRLLTLITLSTVVSSVVVSLGLNTFWLSQLQGKAFFVLLPNRILSTTLIGIGTIIIMNILLIALKNRNLND